MYDAEDVRAGVAELFEEAQRRAEQVAAGRVLAWAAWRKDGAKRRKKAYEKRDALALKEARKRRASAACPRCGMAHANINDVQSCQRRLEEANGQRRLFG